MGRVNVWIPDRVHDAAKAAGLNISRICTDALRDKLGLDQDLPPQKLDPGACADGRHIGPLRRLGYATICEGCGSPGR